jgi:predicted DsbA family dithiol-disulfide isomerase
MIRRTSDIGAELGLRFDYAGAVRSRTVDAHRLLHLALQTGGPALQRDLKEAMLAAYFIRAEDLGDHDVLRKTAVDTGLDPGRVDAVLASQAYVEAVQADIARARAYGANGVPFFVVDQRYGISGAQPTEVFEQVLERAWSDVHPTLTMAGSDDEVCGPDGCVV